MPSPPWASTNPAALSAVGVKLGPCPAGVATTSLRRKRDAELREISGREGKIRRELARGGISRKAFAERMAKQREKKQEVTRRYNDKLGLSPQP